MKSIPSQLVVWMEPDEEMYAITRRWNGGGQETPCGAGSLRKNTVLAQEAIRAWTEKYGLRTLANAGAGELGWFNDMRLPIEAAHYDLHDRGEGVTVWDITKAALPPADAILCRHVLNHLSPARVVKTLALFRQSAPYLIATQYRGVSEDDDLQHVEKDGYVAVLRKNFIRYDLTLPPFNLGPPLEEADDAHDESAKGRFLAIWKLT